MLTYLRGFCGSVCRVGARLIITLHFLCIFLALKLDTSSQKSICLVNFRIYDPSSILSFGLPRSPINIRRGFPRLKLSIMAFFSKANITKFDISYCSADREGGVTKSYLKNENFKNPIASVLRHTLRVTKSYLKKSEFQKNLQRAR